MIKRRYMDDLAEEIHATAIEKGFWDHSVIPTLPDYAVANPSIYEEKLMLIVSEVAEVLEARRDRDEAAEEEECADIIIRVFDYCAARGFQIDSAVRNKMSKNRDRPHLHGRVR